MERSKDQLKKMFPHLTEDMEKKRKKLVINSVRSDVKTGEKIASARLNSLSKYNPDVVSFIRRCYVPEQAEEIIDYLKLRGKITHEYAKRLRKQLHESGLQSFGEKKEPGFYFRKYYHPPKEKETKERWHLSSKRQVFSNKR